MSEAWCCQECHKDTGNCKCNDGISELGLHISSGKDIYSMKGYKKAFMLYDVVFFYRGGMLFHYSGSLGGWGFYNAIEIEESRVDKYIENWSKS